VRSRWLNDLDADPSCADESKKPMFQHFVEERSTFETL
jgi:hypothetical protein